jgi:hypothetical protein
VEVEVEVDLVETLVVEPVGVQLWFQLQLILVLL